MIKLLKDFGIYVRDCSDKIGLGPGYVRVASRSFEENQAIYAALSIISKEYSDSINSKMAQ